MPMLLRIDASSRTHGSHSRELADYFVKKWTQDFPDGDVVVRDLIAEPLPHITEQTITGFYTPERERTVELQQATALSDQLLAEMDMADALLINTPMYNFSVPSAMKAWIDQVLRMGRTFSYSPDEGFKGLSRIKSAYLITASGAVFSDEEMQSWDFLTPYLKAVLSFMGIPKIDFFALEGTTVDPAAFERTQAAAKQRIDAMELSL